MRMLLSLLCLMLLATLADCKVPPSPLSLQNWR